MLSVTDPGSFGASGALVGVERGVVDGVTGVPVKTDTEFLLGSLHHYEKDH